MKELCKICPQSAICAVEDRGNHTGGIWDTAFYPRRIETWNDEEIVFECFAPRRTGEVGPSNGGGLLDVFRVKLKKYRLFW